MSRAVLADTGPLYALVDPSDQHHRRAREELSRLQAAGRFIVVAYPILAEAFTLVERRLGPALALNWLKEVMEGCASVNPESADYLEAVTKVAGFRGHGISLFDAVVGVLSGRLGCPVWTFDHDFDLMRVKRWS